MTPKTTKRPPGRSVAGRPVKFDPAMCPQVERLCRLGATDRDIAEFFGVTERTVNRWKLEFPDFRQSLKEGKTAADVEVANSLFRRAIGYSYPAVKILVAKNGAVTKVPYERHVPPDVTACIFWLKNRARSNWRDRVEQEVTGVDGGPVKVENSISVTMIASLANLRARLPSLPGADPAPIDVKPDRVDDGS